TVRVAGSARMCGPQKESRPRDFHPQPLAEPYVSLSTHTAPITDDPELEDICQCANSNGRDFCTRRRKCCARRRCPRSPLYFRIAQRARAQFTCWEIRASSVL